MPSSVTAASHPVTIGGKEYQMSPLKDRELEEFNNWMRSSYIQMAREAITPDMSRQEREELLGAAIREARKVSYISPEGREIMQSVDGMARLIWIGIVRNHPALKFEMVREVMVDPDINRELMTVWKEINVGESSQTPLGKAARQARKKRDKAKKSSTPDSAPDTEDSAQTTLPT
jgi:hypothetical protein